MAIVHDDGYKEPESKFDLNTSMARLKLFNAAWGDKDITKQMTFRGQWRSIVALKRFDSMKQADAIADGAADEIICNHFGLTEEKKKPEDYDDIPF